MKYFGYNHKAGSKFHFLINFSLHIASRDQAKGLERQMGGHDQECA